MKIDIVLEKDTPFFATSDAPLALVNGRSVDWVNTEMMDVRCCMFKLNCQIPKKDQNDIKPCAPCFAKLIFKNAQH